MNNFVEWTALVISLLGVLTSSLIAYLVHRSNRQSQRAEMQREITHVYDRLLDYRAEHPEVLALGREWSEACFPAIYRQATAEDRQWAIYYTYTELCSSFCNAVLTGWKSGLLDRSVFDRYYKPLIRLVLTEHFPFFRSALGGKYLSKYIREFISETSKSGWDWEARHRLLILDAEPGAGVGLFAAADKAQPDDPRHNQPQE